MAWTKAKIAIAVGVGVLLAAGTATIILSHPAKPIRIEGIPKDWSVLSGDGDVWNWGDNAITGHSTNGDSILASNRKYGDVTVSAMMSTTNREATLAFRLQDADNGYLASRSRWDAGRGRRRGTDSVAAKKRRG